MKKFIGYVLLWIGTNVIFGMFFTFGTIPVFDLKLTLIILGFINLLAGLIYFGGKLVDMW